MKFSRLLTLIPFSAALSLITLNAYGETLKEAVDMALKSHPQIKAQAYNRLATDQQLKQARGGYYPSLDFSAGAGYSRHREPIVDTLHPLESSVTLTQNLFNGFATSNGVQQQQAAVAASSYKLQGASEAIAFEASRAYLEVIKTQRLLEIAKENLDKHKQIMDKIKKRSDSGVGSKADTEQARGRLVLAESNYIIAETNLQDSHSKYLSLIGRMPGDLTLPVVSGSELPATMEIAVNLAISNNPSLKAAESEIRFREEDYQLMDSPYYPRVDLVLEQKWDEEISSVEERSDELSAMVKLRYNFFNGFRDDSRKSEKMQLINAAREARNSAERQVIESASLAWRAYRANENRIELLKKRIQYSKETAAAYSQQFEIQRRTLLDVLNAEAEAINSQAELVSAEIDKMIAQYHILYISGKLVHHFGLEWPTGSIPEN